MKISEGWLREWVNPAVDTQTLVEQLTMAGLEVDGVEPVAGDFSGVVVGEIVNAEQHPDADKLRVCKVNVGDADLLDIVCGAPNARAGIKVACAKVGAVLPGDFKIKKAKLRGVESFGMLCSASELKLSEESDGIIELQEDAPVGADLREYLQLNDVTIDIDLTPNRGDCLGVYGVAREIGVINRSDVVNIQANVIQPTIDDQRGVHLDAPNACPKYLGRVIKNVKANVPSPLWLTEKLRRSGIRSISPIVDVTQYVLLCLGHPMHAFDLNKLEGDIHVRMAQQDEEMTLLDGQSVKLSDDVLVIADEKKAVAMAGIMGGDNSAISEESTDVFLESAFFTPTAITGRARRFGLHTDASHRYERGVDFELQRTAMEMATDLVLMICGGEPGPITAALDESHMPTKAKVSLREARIKRLIGISFPRADVTDILTRLGMQVTPTDKGWDVEVPSYRFDINIEADLIEELVRIHGYDNLPRLVPQGEMLAQPERETRIKGLDLKDVLVNRGYQEIITYSFVEPEFQQKINPGVEALPLLNPISQDLSVMRTALWPGLLKTAMYNLNRQQERLRLFETGLTFVKEGDELTQEPHLAGLILGNKHPQHWSMEQVKVDFFDIKGDVEALLALTSNEQKFEFSRIETDNLHPGQSAGIFCDGKCIGQLGALHPSVARSIGLDQEVFVFDINLAKLGEAKLPKYEDFSRYPANRRDLAVIVDESVSAYQLQSCALKAGGEMLHEVCIFDVYQGEGMKKDTKSIALGLTIRNPSRTLKDTEVSQIIDKVVVSLKENFDATLRD